MLILNITNILISGVGGQGLVLTTKILAETAFEEGFDLKTSDVIGLSQRGGMIWGGVRFGEKVHSALIPEGEVQILVAMEQLEALRWCKSLKKGSTIILNNQNIYPNRVLIEKEDYPENIKDTLEEKGFDVLSIDAEAAAKNLKNMKVINLVLLGKLSTLLPFQIKIWESIIEKNVPPKTIELNKKAFHLGREL